MIDPEAYTGEELDWFAAKRRAIVAWAVGEIGDQGKGSDKVFGYWRDVCPVFYTDLQVAQIASNIEWCGCFVLRALRANGLAADVRWILGKGFAQNSWKTPTPEPGDFCIKQKNPHGHDVWHHALVETADVRGVGTVDGNSPHVARHTRPAPFPADLVFYSIDALLERALKAEQANV